MNKSRFVSYKDADVIHRRPMNLLDNHELFGLMTLGLRPLPVLGEILKRIQETPDFMVEMFEYGDSNKKGKLFVDWFNSPISGLGDINAKIISEIANNELFSARSSGFLPANLSKHLQIIDADKKQELILAYLRHIEKPEIVFSTSQSGILSLVVFGLNHLSKSKEKNDAIQTIFEYLKRHIHKIAGQPNRFGPDTELREPFEAIVSSFTDDPSIISVSNVLGIVSCFSGDSISAPCVDLPSVTDALNNQCFSTEFASRIVSEIAKDNGFTSEALASYIDGTRALDILSAIVPRKTLLKLAPRSVKGQALSDELGL
jgi:hypothetical protein